MKLPEQGANPGAWASSAEALSPPRLRLEPVARFASTVVLMLEIELRKLRHDPTEMITRIGQPVLWLLVFGQVFKQIRAVPTGGLPYLDFMAPGVLAQSVLFVAIFYGINAVWERELGTVYRFLASPAPRSALVMGKALAAGLRSVPLAGIVYFLCLLLGVNLDASPVALAATVLIVLLSAAVFSMLSLIIACLVKSRERFMGIGQLVTMPMFFASNAIYPIEIMPPWLQALARVNPLTYTVDALRASMLAQAHSLYGIGLDLAILAAAFTLLILIAGRLYPTLGH